MSKDRLTLVISARKTGLATVVAFALNLVSGPAGAQVWTHERGSIAGDGFIDVTTAPAIQPQRIVTRLGGVSPGVAPVISATGVVYIATHRSLRAFAADGSSLWSRPLPIGRVEASPVIGTDGSIYVASTALVRDHTGRVPRQHYTSALAKFTPAGDLVWSRFFPRGSNMANASYGRAAGALSIMRQDEVDHVVAPIYFPEAVTGQVRLVMFNAGGAVSFNTQVTPRPPPTTDSADIGFCDLFPCMHLVFGVPFPRIPAARETVLLPRIAQFSPTPGSPIIVYPDTLGHVVGYQVRVGPTAGEIFRTDLLSGNATHFQTPLYMSSPAMLRGGNSALVITMPLGECYLVISGPALVGESLLAIPRSFTSPAVTAAGDIVIVNATRGLTRVRVFPELRVVGQYDIVGDSMMPAAVSRSHIFVSSTDLMTTLNAITFEREATYQWRGGGRSPPSISPNGRVYAIADDNLYVFGASPCRGPRCDSIARQRPREGGVPQR